MKNKEAEKEYIEFKSSIEDGLDSGLPDAAERHKQNRKKIRKKKLKMFLFRLSRKSRKSPADYKTEEDFINSFKSEEELHMWLIENNDLSH